ncbi:hypothetical protein PF621_gp04 [Salmonella phage vB_SenTO17]|uniref:Uncharacterized protein n=1 Tax=Salmonella phage vB_SenTO17 TaxID=2732254 RepID=A0A7G3T8L2_9CAUD|nr:hypothetical protein PF621_gp04 [Salmonella phage vB_SenTO17]QJQ80387.1 hypothetical protein vBSenTO17_04 [Salmonella phage vB_SenTO17]
MRTFGIENHCYNSRVSGPLPRCEVKINHHEVLRNYYSNYSMIKINRNKLFQKWIITNYYDNLTSFYERRKAPVARCLRHNEHSGDRAEGSRSVTSRAESTDTLSLNDLRQQ